MRYGIISDIHSNLPAFKAVLADMGAVDGYWCLGDVVGYGPDPNECLDLLKSLPHVCIAGNHDWGSILEIEIRGFSADARHVALWTAGRLSFDNRAYLSRLDVMMIREKRFTLAHGSPRQPLWEYIVRPDVADANFRHFSTEVCLVGHSHLPVVFRQETPTGPVETIVPMANRAIKLEGARTIANPGSVGQPRDGDPRAACAVYDTNEDSLDFRRVEYPVEETQEKMRSLKFPPRLIDRLSVGR